jgi:hypothetical protein
MGWERASSTCEHIEPAKKGMNQKLLINLSSFSDLSLVHVRI